MSYPDEKNDNRYNREYYQGSSAHYAAGPSNSNMAAPRDAPPAYSPQQALYAPQPSYAPQQSYAPPPARISPPPPSAARISPTGVDDDGSPQGSIYAQAKAAYDNPLAHNDEWAPTQADYALRALPKIDFMLRVKSRLSRTAGQPFATEPRSFRRQAPRTPTAPFAPIILQPDGKDGLIGAGFKPNYFGPVLAAHDVSAADYARFLEDIFTAGKVSGGGQLVANVAPITMHMGVTGYFVTKAIVRGMARRNEPVVVDTIETWQERFFGPRGLDVYVVAKGERATARHMGVTPEPLSPEVARLTGSEPRSDNRNTRRHSSSSSSSDSEPERSYAHLPKKEAKLQKELDKERRKREKKEHERDRKEARKEKRKEKKDKKDKDKKDKGPWLVIAPLGQPPAGAYAYGGYGRA